MKTASTKTMNVIAAGNYLKYEFWAITLLNGTTYYFTAGDVALSVAPATGPTTFGAANLYKTGFVFVRDKLTQKVGVEVSSLNLQIEPLFDAIGGQPQIAGGNFLSQCRAGVLDGATWLLSKGFFEMPIAGNNVDISPGIVAWWAGVTNNIVAGRFTATVSIDEFTVKLTNLQMPRNMIQAGCVHQLFDSACTVPKANNTYTGNVSFVSTAQPNQIATGSAGPVAAENAFNGAFNQGVITFASGVLAGASFTVALSQTSMGVITYLTTIMPFPRAPSIGDAFTIIPGCDKKFSTCKTKFKNTSDVVVSFGLHYRGCPFVPNPETLYDGGAGPQTIPPIAAPGPPKSGSPASGSGSPYGGGSTGTGSPYGGGRSGSGSPYG
jgi:hypothetical protein